MSNHPASLEISGPLDGCRLRNYCSSLSASFGISLLIYYFGQMSRKSQNKEKHKSTSRISTHCKYAQYKIVKLPPTKPYTDQLALSATLAMFRQFSVLTERKRLCWQLSTFPPNRLRVGAIPLSIFLFGYLWSEVRSSNNSTKKIKILTGFATTSADKTKMKSGARAKRMASWGWCVRCVGAWSEQPGVFSLYPYIEPKSPCPFYKLGRRSVDVGAQRCRKSADDSELGRWCSHVHTPRKSWTFKFSYCKYRRTDWA